MSAVLTPPLSFTHKSVVSQFDFFWPGFRPTFARGLLASSSSESATDEELDAYLAELEAYVAQHPLDPALKAEIATWTKEECRRKLAEALGIPEDQLPSSDATG